MSDYEKVLNEAFESLVQHSQGTDGWTSCGESKGVSSFKKASGGSLNCVKGIGVIKASAEKLVEYIQDGEKSKKWDDTLDNTKVIEQNDKYRIELMTYKASWPTSARDFCVVSGTSKKDDGTCLVACRSVEHPKCPPVKGNVRGEIVDGGFVLKPVADGFEVTYVTMVDLKGSLPSSVVNKVNENAPLCVARLRDLVQA